MRSLEAWGWSPAWAEAWSESRAGVAEGAELVPGRVAEEHRGMLRVLAAGGECLGEVSGRLRYLAAGPLELPGVGDWVALAPRFEEGRGTVHHVLPRRTALVRKAPERAAEAQLLAANVDVVLVVTSLTREFRPRRLERMIALAREGGAEPVVVLSKRDVAEDFEAKRAEAGGVAAGAPVVALSAQTGEGVEALAPFLVPGRTLALLGSSGVGKSTLANRLAGAELLATREVRDADGKGRHATTHRQLLALPGGAVLLDTPGLREVGLWDDEGLASAFPDVEGFARDCRFGDCAHAGEPGCAVQRALAEGTLDPDRLESWRRLGREVAHLATRRDARARHAQRAARKRFARAMRRRPDKRRWD